MKIILTVRYVLKLHFVVVTVALVWFGLVGINTLLIARKHLLSVLFKMYGVNNIVSWSPVL